MKYTSLGAFEEIVLLTIGILGDNAYGVTIKKEIESETGHKPSIGSLHAALYRLEKKGFVDSFESGATAIRGGRRKRYYRITALGKKKIIEANELRNSMLQKIQGLKWDTT